MKTEQFERGLSAPARTQMFTMIQVVECYGQSVTGQLQLITVDGMIIRGQLYLQMR